MEECKKAFAVSPKDRLPALHLPHKNQFIPNKLEVEKKEVADPALNPRVLRNDSIARTWWKKADTFWVPRANVIVSLKTPIIDASAENNIKARLFTHLVRDALDEYSYDAELTGLEYNVGIDSRGLFLDVSGYNDKLPVLLEQVVTTIRDLDIKKDRFEVVRERLTRGYSNWQLQSPYHQVDDYTNWLNAPERDFIVEELAAELSSVTLEGVRLSQKQMLRQEDALKATHMVESILKPRVLPKAQWPILRSLNLTKGSNYVFRKTLKDPANVNHCVETWFYVGSREDRDVRTKTLLLDQMLHEPAFDQLRTKEQLGYIVLSDARAFSTTYGLRFLIQSEMTPEFLDSRIEAFLMRYADTLEKMSETKFEGHKRSLIVRCLEKLRNLDQESTRHWNQITNEYYDFELAQRDAAQIKLLTKPEVIEFFNQRLNHASNQRARLSIHLQAQGKAEGVDKRQEEAQKKADEEPSPGDTVKTAEDITDVRLYKAGLAASSGARPVKDINEYEDMDATLEGVSG
ncbi:Metalloenzyme, LuxS/M16 peptidase-like protein [Fusarium oxysporum f. sp. albedinis]|nr:Metalloenzyme, LuxS/M16 peptidase-like protein [Fusarium oxysporum f. sp. albedinis]